MAKESDDHDPRPIRRTLRRLIKAPAAWSLVWPLALLIGSYFAYSRWYQDYFEARYSELDPEAVSITPPHDYVRTDLVEEVYREMKLNELSPLDKHATAKLASAFKSHPWIKHVHRVRKMPGGKIEIDVDYRRPVAVFHLTGNPAWLERVEAYLKNLGYSIEGGVDELYFPLDGEGRMLPTDRMTLTDTRDLIHIEVFELFPRGNEGTLFGDRRVECAAMLANLLSAVGDQIKIAKITVSGDPRMNLVPKLELITGDNTRLFWGSPPGMEQPRERQARDKLIDLLKGNYVPGGDLSIARKPAPPIR